MAKIKIPWHEFDEKVKNLDTDVAYQLQIQREAIPLIFVPGLMGTCLRRSESGKTGSPDMRWNPSSSRWMVTHFLGATGAYRKKMLVGDRFDAGYLEPDNDDPIGDGFKAIMADYCTGFLNGLKKPGAAVASAVGGNGDWGPLSKIFVFPVYAFGYNWTDDNMNSGEKLARRIQKIIEEARDVTGLCEKVILITHSMGGLVARWASRSSAEASILGIIHGVQPATGAPSAYWRMKAGFEGAQASGTNLKGLVKDVIAGIGGDFLSLLFGSSGTHVTPLFANIPSVLQLLPNKLHRTNDGDNEWLRIKLTHGGKTIKALPESDPYKEIYRIKAVVRPRTGENPSSNEYWGLIDPNLLDPETVPQEPPDKEEDPDAQASAEEEETDDQASSGEEETDGLDWTAAEAKIEESLNELDEMDVRMMPRREPWDEYIHLLKEAEEFHDVLGNYQHPKTFNLRGTGQPTVDVVELRIVSGWSKDSAYAQQGFRGFFTDAKGKKMRAILQRPKGDGDGTVPRSSAGALDNLDAGGKQLPGDREAKVWHQGAYADSEVQKFAIEAIKALCRVRFENKTGRILGNFPAP